MNSKYFIILSIFFVNACAMDKSYPINSALTLDDMQSANAIADAHRAIAQHDFTLLGFDQRGLIVPGTKNINLKAIKAPCSIKKVNGMGDVVKNKNHLKTMQTARTYMKTYNQEVLNSTSCQ